MCDMEHPLFLSARYISVTLVNSDHILLFFVETRETRGQKIHAGYFCAFPLHSYISGIRLIECSKLCLETPGCYSFNYRKSSGGACVLVAPTGGQRLSYFPTDKTDWFFYEMIEEFL